MEREITERLEEARKELLDLGLRNPLINFRRNKARGVEIVDELPEQVFRILVLEGKVMSFEAAADGEKDEEGEDALRQPEEEETSDGLAARHTDSILQTSHGPAKLQKRLLSTYYAARTYIQEQGVNILFLALGMLRWYESDSSDVERMAPLILVPVELYRTSAQSKFRLSYTEEDIGGNLSLQAKLKQDFGIDLPTLPEIDAPSVVQEYFELVARAVSSQPRWHVDDRAIELGFFSFGKFLMYHDLDISQWPEEAKPTDHPVLSSLLGDGFPDAEDRLDDDVHLDELLEPDQVHHIVDADSTQILAMLDALQGHNVVIQGPPGTGKSQTITNLIAEALGQQKTILFVSEKMAALEVVKRRLDGLGLGDACLELHSHKTKKKELLEELRRTLHQGRPRVHSLHRELEILASSRHRLNQYCSALNTPIGQSALTPHQVFGHLLKLQRSVEIELPTLDATDIHGWSGEEFFKRRDLALQLQAQLRQMGLPREHPFWGSRRTLFLPTEKAKLVEAADVAQTATSTLKESATLLARKLQLPIPRRADDVGLLCRAARRALEAPNLEGIALNAAEWSVHDKLVDTVLAHGKRLMELHQKYDSLFIPEAWTHDVLQIRQQLAAHGKKWWRFLIPDYRRARNQLLGLCKSGLPKEPDDRLKAVEAVLEAQRCAKTIEEHASEGRALFGVQWQGPHSDWPVLARIAEWVRALHTGIDRGEIPRGLLDFLAGGPDLEALEPLIKEVETSLQNHLEHAEKVGKLLEIDTALRFGGDQESFELQPFEALQQLYTACKTELDRLQEIVSYNHLAQRMREEEMGFLLRLAEHWPHSGDHLADALSFNWYSKLAACALQEHPILASFDGSSHAQTVETFRRLDRASFEYNKARLALKHWEALPRSSMMGQTRVLNREFQKKRRHLPIRQLMERAGHAIQTIKPVFMMSPMSIATYLPPGSVTFDLVVFDEASQVKPVDAFGAILRGKQTVVVGDSKQLPPTSFFDTVTGSEQDEERDELEMKTSDVESILSLFNAKGAPERMLRWHYRSRHDSLIAVSNREFYSNRLVTFPSPVADRSELGVRFHHLPETFYDRGKTRTNKGEARIVAQAVIRHAREHPYLTLGVATFSQAQAEAIQTQLEILRVQDPSCESFFNDHPEEPFFIKNLENVQGDERDVIFISVGYGRDTYGKVSLNFGPLNKDGGERRLNVLITRARRRCEVFTNLRADDIDLSRTSARGVAALKRYLKFAETGELEMPELSNGTADSPFEETVAETLREHGYNVHHQVGSAGYFIDLAVVDPDHPGRYLLGIECDGATYHSARSARDRDRIRQGVLEGLGWRLYRIWSTDWFRHPKRELEKLLSAIEVARECEDTPSVEEMPSTNGVVSSTVIERERPNETLESDSPSTSYQLFKLPRQTLQESGLHEEPVASLANLLREVVQVESPVHFDEAARRVLEAYGVSRLGARIRERLEHAARYASGRGWLHLEQGFLFDPGQESVPIRDRSHLDPASKKLELVAPAEIDAAILYVVEHAIGITADEVPSEVCSLLGFSRVTSSMREMVEQRISDLLEAEKIHTQNGHLVRGDDGS